MIATIFTAVAALVLTIWLVTLLGITVIAAPVLLASAMAYVESGHNEMVFVPGIVVVALFAWIDAKIS